MRKRWHASAWSVQNMRGEDEEEIFEDIFDRANAASEEGGDALDQLQGS